MINFFYHVIGVAKGTRVMDIFLLFFVVVVFAIKSEIYEIVPSG